MEKWKDIKGYEWFYQVSDNGRVKSLSRKKSSWMWNYKRKEMILKPWLMTIWYFSVVLSKNWISTTKYIHRLISQAFILNPESKKTVNHKNWIKEDNRIENLEWSTQAENNLHAYEKLWKIGSMTWKFWKYNRLSVKVNQYTIKWEFIKKRDSISDIKRETWLYDSNISSCCRWRLKTTWWYIWKYLVN